MRQPTEHMSTIRDRYSMLMQHTIQNMGVYDDSRQKDWRWHQQAEITHKPIPTGATNEISQVIPQTHNYIVPHVIETSQFLEVIPKRNKKKKQEKQEKQEKHVSCCIIGCDRSVTRRLKFSLKCNHHKFKGEHLLQGWNRVCDHHYYSDLYEFKKMKKRIAEHSDITAELQHIPSRAKPAKIKKPKSKKKKIVIVEPNEPPEDEYEEPVQPPDSDEDM
jgi:hypothetical protein